MRKRLNQLVKNYIAKSSLVGSLWNNLPNGIYIFNYHRIGNKAECLYAHDVFSCNAEAFEIQIKAIKSNFSVVNLEELLEVFNSGQLTKRYALITFDDGYKDNYEIALPILLRNQINALFLVATDFIDSDAIPWWDEISFILRHNIGEHLSLPQSGEPILLNTNEIEDQIRIFTRQIKQMTDSAACIYLDTLRDKHQATCAKLKREHNELFMSWENIKCMHQYGMDIGSHTRSHKILSKLTQEQVAEELLESKKIIEDKISAPIRAVAYPVGSRKCYTPETITTAKAIGYEFAFNNSSGINYISSNKHDLNRICVIEDDINKLKLSTVFYAFRKIKT